MEAGGGGEGGGGGIVPAQAQSTANDKKYTDEYTSK